MSMNGRSEAINPTIVGAARRFYRVVNVCLVLGIVGAFLYVVTSSTRYAASAGIAITPPPASVTTPGVATDHVTPAEYEQQQIALISSTEVTARAARLVNRKMQTANLTGTDIKSALTVKPPTPSTANGNNTSTTVTVTLGRAKVAALAADDVVTAYVDAFHAAINQQAKASLDALEAQIQTVKAQVKQLPATTKSGTKKTTTTTTTRPPHVTTTTAPRTTTTRPKGTTSTTTSTTTTTTSSSSTTSSTTTTTTAIGGTEIPVTGTSQAVGASGSTSSATNASQSAGASGSKGSATSSGVTGSGSAATTSVFFVSGDARGHPYLLAVSLAPDQSTQTSTARSNVGNLTATTSTTTSTTGSSTTTSPSSTTTTSPSSTTTTTSPGTGTATTTNTNTIAAERNALQGALASLTRSRAQIIVNRAVDAHFTPTITPAKVPTSPANGHMIRDILIGALMGLVLGLVLAFVLAWTKRRFERAADPGALYAVPLLATVPAFEHEPWVHVGLPLITDPSGEAAEAYRSLATAIRAIRRSEEPLVVSFTASDLGSGTTTTVANLALALADMGERVVAVDADPLGRALSRSLLAEVIEHGLPQVPLGLAEVLNGGQLSEVVGASMYDGRLSVLPAGRDADVAIHRWRSAWMRAVIAELAQDYEIVLVDTPPAGSTSYAMDVIGMAGQVVLVVPHHDPVRNHEDLATKLPVSGAVVLGYVYNGNPPNPDFAPYYPIVTNHKARRPNGIHALARSSGDVTAGVVGDPTRGGVTAGRTSSQGTEAVTTQTPAYRHYEDDTGVVNLGSTSSTQVLEAPPGAPAYDDTGVVPRFAEEPPGH